VLSHLFSTLKRLILELKRIGFRTFGRLNAELASGDCEFVLFFRSFQSSFWRIKGNCSHVLPCWPCGTLVESCSRLGRSYMAGISPRGHGHEGQPLISNGFGSSTFPPSLTAWPSLLLRAFGPGSCSMAFSQNYRQNFTFELFFAIYLYQLISWERQWARGSVNCHK
jgi:hypothetical protein